ncbi:hypothetical protein VQH23_22635 [Pararoseomonas sp. SCSIO 73927]|uniref:hypothetical protein n=1 Tax=Pararoseomonas sp. SCSIO 73927 TaxID=3114537 RepID=UPI0030D1CFE8
MSIEERPPVDSRRWTGPEDGPVPVDRRAAGAAFRAAGGPGAAAPQRAASAVSWAGLALVLPVVMAGAGQGTWLLGLEPVAARLRSGLEAALHPTLGLKGAEGMMALLGDPRLLAALLALAGTLAGIVSAWRHRAALARGFTAAEAGVPGAVFSSYGHWGMAPFIVLLVGWRPLESPLLLPNALVLWLLARLAAGSLTAMAERWAAGLGAGSPRPSGWDLANMALSLGALLLLLGRALWIL